MGLKDYRRKRDFTRTPEPEGGEASTGSGRLYVIQMHAATRLHYDLRLELDGVLKSWAVPRGPSLDPTVKRLAVRVEDHPLGYGTFEGIIPAGEYGGGTVMLWDRGTWEPEGDPGRDLAGGKLSFRLQGKKLRGSWALAQMREKDGRPGKNWLLIKHRDAEARPERDYSVVEAEPLSVATKRTLAQIAAASAPNPGPGPAPDPSRLTGARPARLPASIKPQLATLVAAPPAGAAWLHEIKLDGYRILARLEAGRVALLSRRGLDWTRKFATVAEALRALPVEEAILDGEIVALRPDGTSDFQALQDLLRGGKKREPVYYLFDLPHCNGYDLTRAPLGERKELLRAILARMPPAEGAIRLSDHIRGSGEEVFRQACLLAAEGIVSKDSAGAYEQKRSRHWRKTKCLRRQELLIGGWSERAGARPGLGALLVGYYERGELVYAGRVGTGLKARERHRLAGLLLGRERPAPPFRNPPSGAAARGVHWVEPELIAEVEFREWTRDNILRQASFKGLREDKTPEEVVREAPAGEAGLPAAPAGRRTAAAAVVAGVRITHPDKILFSGQGASKLALAAYYEAIADFVLPHVAHRPLTLLRCPDGSAGECFYQKHLGEALPAALRAIPIREKDTLADYVVIDDLRGLISLVQLGVLEIHPWGSTEAELEKPDILTFDLDPGPGVGWPEVVGTARLLRHRLAALGLESFVKTSGGKGLHVVAPVQPRSGWEEAKAFARAVALDLARLRPQLLTADPRKAKRQGRIFVDYLRNGRGATTVAAYSTRAGAGAPVSAPIRWDELGPALTPDRYRIDNLPKRLAALKSDPWPGFFEIRQEIPVLRRRKP